MNFTVLVCSTGTLISNTYNLTGHCGVPSVMVNVAMITFNASVPRFFIGVGTTFGRSDRVTLAGVLNDGVLGVLIVLNISTSVCPLEYGLDAIGIRVPLTVVTTLIIFVVNDGCLKLVGCNSNCVNIAHFSNIVLLIVFTKFVFCAVHRTEGRGGSSRIRDCGRVGL